MFNYIYNGSRLVLTILAVGVITSNSITLANLNHKDSKGNTCPLLQRTAFECPYLCAKSFDLCPDWTTQKACSSGLQRCPDGKCHKSCHKVINPCLCNKKPIEVKVPYITCPQPENSTVTIDNFNATTKLAQLFLACSIKIGILPNTTTIKSPEFLTKEIYANKTTTNDIGWSDCKLTLKNKLNYNEPQFLVFYFLIGLTGITVAIWQMYKSGYERRRGRIAGRESVTQIFELSKDGDNPFSKFISVKDKSNLSPLRFTGYSDSRFGTAAMVVYVGVLAAWNLFFWIAIIANFNLFSSQHISIFRSETNNIPIFALTWSLTTIWLFFITVATQRTRNYFRLRTPLYDAKYVLVEWARIKKEHSRKKRRFLKQLFRISTPKNHEAKEPASADTFSSPSLANGLNQRQHNSRFKTSNTFGSLKSSSSTIRLLKKASSMITTPSYSFRSSFAEFMGYKYNRETLKVQQTYLRESKEYGPPVTWFDYKGIHFVQDPKDGHFYPYRPFEIPVTPVKPSLSYLNENEKHSSDNTGVDSKRRISERTTLVNFEDNPKRKSPLISLSKKSSNPTTTSCLLGTTFFGKRNSTLLWTGEKLLSPSSTLYGLTHNEADRRLSFIGSNQTPISEPSFGLTIWNELSGHVLFSQWWVLWIWILQDFWQIAMVLIVVFPLSALFMVTAEYRSISKRKILMHCPPLWTVKRQGVWQKVDGTKLVPGDIIKIKQGCELSWDGVLISGILVLDESRVTGSSQPQYKSATKLPSWSSDVLLDGNSKMGSVDEGSVIKAGSVVLYVDNHPEREAGQEQIESRDQYNTSQVISPLSPVVIKTGSYSSSYRSRNSSITNLDSTQSPRSNTSSVNLTIPQEAQRSQTLFSQISSIDITENDNVPFSDPDSKPSSTLPEALALVTSTRYASDKRFGRPNYINNFKGAHTSSEESTNMELLYSTTDSFTPISLLGLSFAFGFISGKLRQLGIYYNRLFQIMKVGEIKVACFDKTGTLTSGKMELECVFPTKYNYHNKHSCGIELDEPVFAPDVLGNMPSTNNCEYYSRCSSELESNGGSNSSNSAKDTTSRAIKDLPEILRIGMGTCHQAHMSDGSWCGSATDIALVKAINWRYEPPVWKHSQDSEQDEINVKMVKNATYLPPREFINGLERLDNPKEYEVLARFPFDPYRRTMMVVVLDKITHFAHVFVKGPPDAIMRFCLDSDGVPYGWEKVEIEWTSKGYAVLAMAHRDLGIIEDVDGFSRQLIKSTTAAMSVSTSKYETIYGNNYGTDIDQLSRDSLEAGCECIGLFVLKDSLRPETVETISTLRRWNIRTLMMTGDTAHNAVYVAKKSGILPTDLETSKETYIGSLFEQALEKNSSDEGKESISTVVWTNTATKAVVFDMDKVLSDASKENHAGSLASKIELVVTSSVFNRLIEEDAIELYIPYIRIFAQVTPRDKTQIAQLKYFNSRKCRINRLLVMVGDSISDYGALESSHAGVLLGFHRQSTPPDSRVICSIHTSILTVKELICYGKTLVATSHALYLFMMIYWLCLTCLQLYSQTEGEPSSDGGGPFMSKMSFMVLHIFYVVIPALLLATSRPSLDFDHKPNVRSLGFQTLLSGILQAIVYIGFFIGMIFILKKQDWYQCHAFQSRALAGYTHTVKPWDYYSTNYEASTFTILVLAQLLMVVNILNLGNMIRRTWWRNCGLMMYSFMATSFLLVLLLAPPNVFGCGLKINCGLPDKLASMGYQVPSSIINHTDMAYKDSPLGQNVLPMKFRTFLLVYILANFAASLGVETIIVRGPVGKALEVWLKVKTYKNVFKP
ncbi:hypothetical protein H4219_003321 [Mycoemilia scoparia]|uniref:P-type ATPase A domain-containing protein n=1 Tax=Mycoemilia scoparia TaxID=417184 RepID=A0A9W8A1L7_9FUNG|nr:hypothetical protein H4219_003321 [Mycoemilia scoparia]